MNKLYLSGLIGLFIISISACSKYDPIYGVANHGNQGEVELKMDLAYIHDNDIYVVNEIFAEETRLTSTPFSTKTHVALSPLHDKVAYLDANGTPVILDLSGNVLETLSSYNNVTDMKWHFNSGNPTLYLLINNSIVFHGPSLAIPSNPFDFAFPSTTTYRAIDAVDINDNLDIAFSYRYQVPYLTSLRKYYYGAAVNFASTSFDEFKETYQYYYDPGLNSYSQEPYAYYHLVNFNENDQNVSLGQVSNGSENNQNAYQLKYFHYVGTNSISTLSTTLNAENYYREYNEGDVVSNEFQIKKYLKVIPPNTPEPTGTPNTYIINFPNQNGSPPTYFDWNP